MKFEFKFDDRDPKKLEIFLNEEKWRSVPSSLFLMELKKFPEEMEEGEFLQRFGMLEKKAASQEVLRLISLKSYLSSELEKKLKAKGITEPAISHAIESFESRGYIDDRAKLLRLIELDQNKGWAKRMICAKLSMQKNVDTSFLNEVLNEAGRSDEEVLKEWVRKSAKKLMKLPERKLIQKLMQRGFSYEVVRKVQFSTVNQKF